MKKKIRWKLLGALRVHHCYLASTFRAITRQPTLYFVILLLFSLGISYDVLLVFVVDLYFFFL